MTVAGRSLELYFIDGRPDGMLTAEVFNWTGHILMTPRTQLAKALSRREAGYTGVYLLLGEQDGEPLAYIGESEDIGGRIRDHDSNKDWWSTAILVTSAANNLHKAHMKYLESRLVEEARSIGTVPLDNGNTPPRSSLSEAAQANMEAFLETLLMVLPALRVDMFLRRTRPVVMPVVPTNLPAAPLFELVSKKHGLEAKAILIDGDFIVRAGSRARLEWSGKGASIEGGYASLHRELLQTGVLRADGDTAVFIQNYAFSSTSGAAAIVMGRSANGTTDWKVVGQNRTYKDWEADQLSRKEATE